MSTRFDRQFDLERLQPAIAGRADHWFNDLLRCCQPSGAPSGDTGLRLAIRNGYLNFYRLGQSVARVGIGAHGTPWLYVHWKYVTDREPAGSPYLKLVDQHLLKSGRPVGAAYAGAATLRRWTKSANAFAGHEKKEVDGVVAANGAVIDLEVAAPAEKPPFRVDLVALERRADGLHVVFWEAKLAADSRLVAKGRPKVIEQVEKYGRFLQAEGNAERLLSAYRKNCRLLHAFHIMARQVQPGIPALDAAVVAVAQGASVTPDTTPRLVIITGVTWRPSADWGSHLEKLRQAGLTFVVLPSDGGLRLPGRVGSGQ